MATKRWTPRLLDLAADALTRDFLQRPDYWASRTELLAQYSDMLPLLQTQQLNCPYLLPETDYWRGDRWAHRQSGEQIIADELVTGERRTITGRILPKLYRKHHMVVESGNVRLVYSKDFRCQYPPGAGSHYNDDSYTLSDELDQTFDYQKRLVGTCSGQTSSWYIAGLTWQQAHGSNTVRNDRGEVFTPYTTLSNGNSLILHGADWIYITHRGRQVLPKREIVRSGADYFFTRDQYGLYRHDGQETYHWPGTLVMTKLLAVRTGYVYQLVAESGRTRCLDLSREQTLKIDKHGIITAEAIYDKHGWCAYHYSFGRVTLNRFDFAMTLWERWCLTTRIRTHGWAWCVE